jgi:hypothetical protein
MIEADPRRSSTPARGAGSDSRPVLRFWDRISQRAWRGLGSASRSGEGQGTFLKVLDGFGRVRERHRTVGS